MTKLRDIPFQPSTLETIDRALYNWVKALNLFATTNKGFKEVPVLWASAERAHMAKRRKEDRDNSGTVTWPLITIERTSVVKNPTNKGSAWGNVPPVGDKKGGSITIARRIKHDKTANFANADQARQPSRGINFVRKETKKVVYETISIPMPVYLDVMFKISLKSQYQQQMNEMSQPFMTKTGGINYFTAKHEGHSFEGFIQQDFAQENNSSDMAEEERRYITNIEIKMLGYVIGADVNQEQPKIVIRENAVSVKIPREHVIVGDIPDFTDKQKTYVGSEGIGDK